MIGAAGMAMNAAPTARCFSGFKLVPRAWGAIDNPVVVTAVTLVVATVAATIAATAYAFDFVGTQLAHGPLLNSSEYWFERVVMFCP